MLPDIVQPVHKLTAFLQLYLEQCSTETGVSHPASVFQQFVAGI
jgi:hypothetical protein